MRRRDASYNYSDRFELMADLYYRRYHRLPPGKSDALRDSSEPANQEQWEAWLATGQAYRDLQDHALALECQVKAQRQIIEDPDFKEVDE